MRYGIPVVLVKTACTGKLVFLLMYHAPIFLKNGYFDSFRFPKEAPRTLFRNAVQKIPLVAFWITGENVKTTATILPS